VIYVITFCDVNAQQLSQYTQYMLNEYAVNQAIAGSKEYAVLHGSIRSQWTGLAGSPKTSLLSFYGPSGKNKDNARVGLGAFLYNDVIGATTRTNFLATYAYHLFLKKSPGNNIKLSLALSGGFTNYKIDINKITIKDVGDPMILDLLESAVLPDANFAAYLYANNYYAGISFNQLLRSKIKMTETISDIGNLMSHQYIYGGYKYQFNEQILIEPSVILKRTSNLPLHADINIRGEYQKKFWAGITYRTYDAIALLLGYIHNEQLYFGYSYDFTTSALRRYSFGSHEIVIGYRIYPKQYRPMDN